MEVESLNDYQIGTNYTAIYPEIGKRSLISVNYCLLGLGEAGEAQGKLKKVWRGDKLLGEAREAIIDEIGDTLWYIARAADELGVTLKEVAQRNLAKTYDRKLRGVVKGDGDNR